jgi:hypothetical protein
LDILNRIVAMFLDQAEFRTLRRQVVYMADWEAWLDKFLNDQELPILNSAGCVRMDDAQTHAQQQYDLYHAQRLASEANVNAKALAELENSTKYVVPAQKKRGGSQ